MSTTPPSSTPPSSPGSNGSSPPGSEPKRSTELKLVSHSNLFYWWPVWVLGFFMALWTWIENDRLVIVPPHGSVRKVVEVGSEGSIKKIVEVEKNSETHNGDFLMTFKDAKGNPRTSNSLENATKVTGNEEAFTTRMSQDSWLGGVFLIGLLLTIVITNVPLRGLWSFIALILIVVLALVISLLRSWDALFDAFGNLRIHINMAGYLFIGTVVFIVWLLATFVFDRRSYIIFTPGQIRVCEHVGAAVKVYDTYGIHMEKQRDDLFRHYILGFGSGDLTVVTSGAERHEIKLPNVLGIGWRLKHVEDMLRERTTTAA